MASVKLGTHLDYAICCPHPFKYLCFALGRRGLCSLEKDSRQLSRGRTRYRFLSTKTSRIRASLTTGYQATNCMAGQVTYPFSVLIS